MLSNSQIPTRYARPQATILAARLAEPRRFLLAVAGPRQVGKTTLVQSVVEASALPARFASADEPTLRGAGWIAQQWEAIRLAAADAGLGGAVLVLDEVQKIPGWSASVHRLCDEDKPAVLRRLFELACRYSGQVLSYTKMLGQLQDAGNVTTLAHYLDLLAGVGMVTGLQKYAGDVARQRGSSPKLQVLNTALLTAQ